MSIFFLEIFKILPAVSFSTCISIEPFYILFLKDFSIRKLVINKQFYLESSFVFHVTILEGRVYGKIGIFIL